MSVNTDQVLTILSSNDIKDAALILEEEISTQKSESLIIRIPSITTGSESEEEVKPKCRESRKRTKSQIKVLIKYFW